MFLFFSLQISTATNASKNCFCFVFVAVVLFWPSPMLIFFVFMVYGQAAYNSINIMRINNKSLNVARDYLCRISMEITKRGEEGGTKGKGNVASIKCRTACSKSSGNAVIENLLGGDRELLLKFNELKRFKIFITKYKLSAYSLMTTGDV